MTTLRFSLPTAAFAAVLALSTPANAITNMRDGGYFNSWIDLEHTSSHEALRVNRVYQSRSSTIGLFGFGWCTPLETKLTRVSDGEFRISECGRGEELSYLKKGSTFPARNRANDRLIAGSGGHMLRLADGRTQNFDASGRLVEMIDQAGRRLTLSYDKLQRLNEIAAPQKGAAIRFGYDKDGSHVARAEVVGTSHTVKYEYDGFDLVRVSGAGSTFAHTYDRLHNLETIREGSTLAESITYDQAQDRVTSVSATGGCRETYKYELDGARVIVSESLRACADARVSPARARFEFWYGDQGLARMRVEGPRGSSDISFDSNGQASILKQNRAPAGRAKGGT